ncbi:hypothetical protein QQZ08_006144 [Neonectria magnoliae]|uniref:Uncharacterized protein n=1 Tax=Neonectria magnoliae TaxID=2732573 RepID=A0ABR1I1J6_9HYPO
MESDDEPTCEICATIIDVFSAEFELSAILDLSYGSARVPGVDSKWASQAQEKIGPALSIRSFMPTVTDLNKKSLTMSEDSPKAFAGIQAMLHRVHPGGLLFGRSEFFFEIFLTWSRL